jgi:hypothetical protein
MGTLKGERRIGESGRVYAVHVADDDEGKRLVEGDPVLHPVAELAAHDGGVVAEPARDVAVSPPAAVLQRLRQIPVIERDERRDVALEQRVDQAAVEIESGLVGLADPLRLHARPGDREAVGVEAEASHQPNVLAIAVVVVAGDVADVAVLDLARRVRERVPDRRTAAVGAVRAFDLIGRGRRAPQKAVRESSHSAPLALPRTTAFGQSTRKNCARMSPG